MSTVSEPLSAKRKLVADLKAPFVLKGNFRQDDTPCTVPCVRRWSMPLFMPTIQAGLRFW